MDILVHKIYYLPIYQQKQVEFKIKTNYIHSSILMTYLHVYLFNHLQGADRKDIKVMRGRHLIHRVDVIWMPVFHIGMSEFKSLLHS